MRGRWVAGAVLGALLAGVGGLTAARAGEALPGAAVEGTDEQKRKAFTDAALTLRRRIELFLSLPMQRLDAMSLQHELRSIGTK